jgi:hypothetical protein
MEPEPFAWLTAALTRRECGGPLGLRNPSSPVFVGPLLTNGDLLDLDDSAHPQTLGGAAAVAIL